MRLFWSRNFCEARNEWHARKKGIPKPCQVDLKNVVTKVLSA